MEYLFCARHSPCVAIWVSSVPWGKRRNEGTVQDGTASVLRLAERGFEPGVSTPARTHFHHPASRNGRQSTHAKANIMRTFLHVLFIHKNDTNWLVL